MEDAIPYSRNAWVEGSGGLLGEKPGVFGVPVATAPMDATAAGVVQSTDVCPVLPHIEQGTGTRDTNNNQSYWLLHSEEPRQHW